MSDAVTVSDLVSLPAVRALRGDKSVQVSGVRSDSRAIEPGELFAAIVGEQVDGAKFAQSAVERGASAVLAQRMLTLPVPVLLSEDVRRTLGPVSQRVYGDPTQGLPTFGVTGTNGKTTVVYLLESMVQAAWGQPAVLGTVASRGPAGQSPSAMTTPEADDIARFTREQRDAGATALLMEVSSHALSQGRADGLLFDVAAFTNLTQDHLDFHGDLDSYGEAKARLFTELSPGHSVVMVDTDFGRQLAARADSALIQCSMHADSRADFRVVRWDSGRSGLRAVVHTPDGEVEVQSPLLGSYNMENLLVALASARALHIDMDTCLRALASAQGAPGRMERVDDPRGVTVVVDYAHTPDALARALAALRPITAGFLWVVCGCGGDRDAAKRAPMGEAAARGADRVVLTSDNPRTEDPDAILAQMEPGAASTGANRCSAEELATAERGYLVEPGRADAIVLALRGARAGDTVLIAGKGHEDYQILGSERIHFDDREHARAAIDSIVGEGG